MIETLRVAGTTFGLRRRGRLHGRDQQAEDAVRGRLTLWRRAQRRFEGDAGLVAGLTGFPSDKVSIKVLNICSGDCWKNGLAVRAGFVLLTTGLAAETVVAPLGFNCPIRFGFTPTAAD